MEPAGGAGRAAGSGDSDGGSGLGGRCGWRVHRRSIRARSSASRPSRSAQRGEVGGGVGVGVGRKDRHSIIRRGRWSLWVPSMCELGKPYGLVALPSNPRLGGASATSHTAVVPSTPLSAGRPKSASSRPDPGAASGRTGRTSSGACEKCSPVSPPRCPASPPLPPDGLLRGMRLCGHNSLMPQSSLRDQDVVCEPACATDRNGPGHLHIGRGRQYRHGCARTSV